MTEPKYTIVAPWPSEGTRFAVNVAVNLLFVAALVYSATLTYRAGFKDGRRSRPDEKPPADIA